MKAKAPLRIVGLAALLVVGAFGVYLALPLALRAWRRLPVIEEELSAVANPVLWIWAGALGPESFRVNFRLQHPCTSVDLLVSESPDLTPAQRFVAVPEPSPGEPRELYTARSAGLAPGTRHYYAIEADGEIDRGRIGSVVTPHRDTLSFQIAFGSCSYTGSNAIVFDTIRAYDPQLFLHLGDFHYANIGEESDELFLNAMERVLRTPRQARLLRSTAVVYVWDDHDFGRDDCDSSSPSGPAAQRVYRACVPHYPLAEGDRGPIYQAFTIGRVRFLVTDGRSRRRASGDSAQRTVLGSQQKEWLEDELRAASEVHPVVFWINPTPWIAAEEPGADHWGGYPEERREIAELISTLPLRGLFILSGDAHLTAYDDGTNNTYAGNGEPGFPVFHASPLDQRVHDKAGPFTAGPVFHESQFGLVTVEDDGGETIVVRFEGKTADGETRLEGTFEVDVND